VSAPRPTEGDAATATLARVARRLAAASAVSPAVADPTLEAVVEVAVAALDARASSVALYDRSRDRLVFVAAAGSAAAGVVGLEIESGAGIAGYAFSTGQPLAVADVERDPRFDRATAEATGYIPRSLLATPLLDEDGAVGVLEALDRRDGSGFTLRDLDVAGRIARLGVLAVRRSRLEHDAAALLRRALEAVVAGAAGSADEPMDDAGIDRLVSLAAGDLEIDPDDPTWRLADRLARLRDVDPASVDLAVEWLDALLRRRAGAGRGPDD
jgi:GAF domain-containing protein